MRNGSLILTFLILPLFSLVAARPHWEDDVMVQQKGSSYIFIFPPSRSRVENPTGEITIGDSIAIMYALKVLRSSRFIGFDGSALSQEEFAKLRPRLSERHAPSKAFGFMVRDSIQPMMHIHIEPSFMAKKATTESLEKRIAKEGNLTVIFGVTKSGVLRIVQAILD